MKFKNWAGESFRSWLRFIFIIPLCRQFKFPTCLGYIILIKEVDKYQKNHYVHKSTMRSYSCKWISTSRALCKGKRKWNKNLLYQNNHKIKTILQLLINLSTLLHNMLDCSQILNLKIIRISFNKH